MTRPNPLRVALAVVLLASAAGFAVASAAERAKEHPAGATLSAPEGSAAREAAERTTPSTIADSTTVAQPPQVATAPAPTGATTNAPEGSPAREAAERARRNGATSTSATSSPPLTTATTATVPAAPTTVIPTTAAPSPPRVVGEELFGVRTESAGATAAAVLALVVAAALVLALPDRRVLLAVAAFALLLAVLDGREALHQHDEARAGLVAAALLLTAAHLIATALSLGAYLRTPKVASSK